MKVTSFVILIFISTYCRAQFCEQLTALLCNSGGCFTQQGQFRKVILVDSNGLLARDFALCDSFNNGRMALYIIDKKINRSSDYYFKLGQIDSLGDGKYLARITSDNCGVFLIYFYIITANGDLYIEPIISYSKDD